MIQIKRFEVDTEEEIEHANEFLASLPDDDVIKISYGIAGSLHYQTVLIAYKTK